MEIATCNHKKETLASAPAYAGMIVADCLRCGQRRRYKQGDDLSLVIMKLGRINGAIVMPPVGIPLGVTKEESLLVRAGWDKLKDGAEEKVFQEKLQQLTVPPVTELEQPEPVTGPEPAAEPEPEPEPVKTYYCKKCEYSTPDKNTLIGHYSSEHSWHHREKDQKRSGPEPGPVPQFDVPDLSTMNKQGKGKFYDEHTTEILADLEKLGLIKMLERWQISRGGWINIRRRWQRKGIVVNDPSEVKEHTDRIFREEALAPPPKKPIRIPTASGL